MHLTKLEKAELSAFLYKRRGEKADGKTIKNRDCDILYKAVSHCRGRNLFPHYSGDCDVV